VPEGRKGSEPSALESPALGSGERIQPCGEQLRPADPPPVPAGPTLGLTFSGGGFRATFAALGALRYVADAGLLASVRYVSSVSGGSIANGLLARHWPVLRARGFSAAAVDELVIYPAVARVSGRSLKLTLIGGAWRIVGSETRTDLLARNFDRWFFDGLRLEDLDPEVRWVVNAANLVTGVRFGFERDVVGDYVVGLARTTGTGLRLSQAAAASAAVPGAFAPWKVEGIDFPCATQAPVLLDGGVYDNTGLEVLDGDRHRSVFTVTMNAGGLLRPGGYGKIPVVRELARANSLLYRQSTSLRTRMMVSSFRLGDGAPIGGPLPRGARHGALVGLATDVDDPGGDLAQWRQAFPELRTWEGRDLSLVPTVFDKLPAALCRALVYRGWWLAGAAVARYYPELGPAVGSIEPPPSA
jgi:NTE family protein